MMDFGAAMFFTDYSMTAAELGQALEARGFESVWAPEHSHIPSTRKTPPAGGGELGKQYYDVMDPFVTLTAAAMATKTLKVGTGVCLVIQRDTIQTAKLVASIDHVSSGRFLFGIGGGWNQDEIESHGTVFTTRFKKMREQIEAMKEIWTKSEPEYHGEIVEAPKMRTWPKPAEKPAPAGYRRGRLPAQRPPRDPLRRRLDPQCEPGALCRCDRVFAGVPRNGDHRRARPGVDFSEDLGRPGKCGSPKALPRSGDLPRRGEPAFGEPRRNPSCARPLGRADPPDRTLT